MHALLATQAQGRFDEQALHPVGLTGAGLTGLIGAGLTGLTGLTGAGAHAQGRSVGRAGAHAQGRSRWTDTRMVLQCKADGRFR